MATRFRVEVTASAKSDLQSIHAYIAGKNKRAAGKWLREFHRQARSLQSMPLRYEIIPEADLVGAPYRHIIYGKYRIIYRIASNRIIIQRVVHAARLLDQTFFS